MIAANPGNLLKFNTDAVWQRHNQPGQNRLPFGLRTPKERCLPFQIFVEAGISSATWELIDPVDPTGGTSFAMDAGDLIVTNGVDGGAWVTHTGFTDLTNPVDCGYYEAWVTIDGIVYKSEVMHFFEAGEGATVYRLRFTNSKDKGNVLYTSFSYHQFLYPVSWAWDRPVVDRDVEIVVDGNNNETTRFSRTVARYKLEVSDIPDYCIPFFAKCGDLDGVQFEDYAGAIAVVPMANIVFESRAQGVGLNVGVFTFDAEIESFNGCQPDFSTE